MNWPRLLVERGEEGEGRRLGCTHCDVQMGAAGRVPALPLELKRGGGAIDFAGVTSKGRHLWQLRI